MITLVQALNYRCLRYVRRPLGPFHVLVGRNATGKTTFLDVIGFLGRFVSDGLDAAVEERSATFQDLVWGRSGSRFELAVEADIPSVLRQSPANPRGTSRVRVRYEVAIQIDSASNERQVAAETLTMENADDADPVERTLFPDTIVPPATILRGRLRRAGKQIVVNKVTGGNDNFTPETESDEGKRWAPSFRLGPRKSALGNLPDDETKFPVATWFRGLLARGVEPIVLNSLLIRRPSPPGKGAGFRADGSNLPWVVDALRSDPARFRQWIDHVRTALPEIADIRTVERPEDRHRYLVLHHANGMEIPSWLASDGTLRLLALTLPAYLAAADKIYLIEEPENGIHPTAVETVFKSLSNVYDAQVLMATHSPVILGIAEPEQILCFARTAEGATDVVRGKEHPALQEWRGEMDLGTLFAAGVL